MSRSKLPQTVNQGDWDALRNIAHELQPLFDLEGEWTTADAPGKWDMKSQAIIRKAHIHNAIQTKGTAWVERDDVENGKKRKHVVYEWNPEIKERLRKYNNEQSKLPCGHPTHIKNHGDSYGCRYCPDDEQPEYSEEIIRRVME